MQNDFIQAVEFSHWLLKRHVKKGARLVDATAGRGHDTLFMAELTGEDGYVWAFDIQKEAVEDTSRLIAEHGFEDRVEIIKDNHKNVSEYIKEKLDGIIFNLGYLPGGDKKITTNFADTLEALKSSLDLLKAGGVAVLVCYTGHPGGEKETEDVKKYLKKRNHKEFNVLHYHFINQEVPPPQVFAAVKRK